MVPQATGKRRYNYGYTGVLYDDGSLAAVRNWRLELLRRGTTHRKHWRRILQFERRHFDKRAETDPGPEIAESRSPGWIPEHIIWTGLQMAFAEDWKLADGCFKNARRAGELLEKRYHRADKGGRIDGDDLSRALRVRALAQGLLDETCDSDLLIEACHQHAAHARTIERSRWDEDRQCDYVEFALTALLAGHPDTARELLDLERPFRHQQELLDLYRGIAGLETLSPSGEYELSAKCDALLEIMRHPNGSRFLQFGPLTPVMFAQTLNLYFTPSRERRGFRDIVAWLGR